MDPREPHYFGTMTQVTDAATGTLACGHSFPGRQVRGKRARCPLCAERYRRDTMPEFIGSVRQWGGGYWAEVLDGKREFRHEEVA